MSDILKFPNGGYDVTVCRKEDIINCIYNNITDREVALEIIKQLEEDAAEFISKGVWTGLPFIGNVKLPDGKKYEDTEEQKELLEEAKETLDPKQYIIFRNDLGRENAIKEKRSRFINYITSMLATKNKSLYKRYCKLYGESATKVFLYTTRLMECVSNYEDEQQTFD